MIRLLLRAVVQVPVLGVWAIWALVLLGLKRRSLENLIQFLADHLSLVVCWSLVLRQLVVILWVYNDTRFIENLLIIAATVLSHRRIGRHQKALLIFSPWLFLLSLPHLLNLIWVIDDNHIFEFNSALVWLSNSLSDRFNIEVSLRVANAILFTESTLCCLRLICYSLILRVRKVGTLADLGVGQESLLLILILKRPHELPLLCFSLLETIIKLSRLVLVTRGLVGNLVTLVNGIAWVLTVLNLFGLPHMLLFELLPLLLSSLSDVLKQTFNMTLWMDVLLGLGQGVKNVLRCLLLLVNPLIMITTLLISLAVKLEIACRLSCVDNWI